MAIEQISKIINHRIFSNFVWPQSLPDFKEKNLFYGWNGTGKSTLSNLFRLIEKQAPIPDGDGQVEFIINGKEVNGENLGMSQELPQVRVFNKDFIAENVFTSHGGVTPILFLGKKNIEKQEKLEKLKRNIEKTKNKKDEKDKEKGELEKALEQFKTEQAGKIKELLRSGGDNAYYNYNKRSYKDKCDELFKLSPAERKAKILNESDFDAHKKKKESASMETIDILNFNFPDTQKLTNQIVPLLKETVVSSVIETLKDDQELSGWVKTGLTKHKKDNSCNCLFCGQPLPNDRIQELEAHFNDKYNAFIDKIEKQSVAVKSAIEDLKPSTIPNELALYEHLKSKFNTRYEDLDKEIGRIKKYLESLLATLNDKLQKPFQSIERSFDVCTGNVNVVSDLNAVIEEHNRETNGFEVAISTARTALEESMLVKELPEYEKKKDNIEKANEASNELSAEYSSLEAEVLKIKKDIDEHSRPADELNDDIRSYLGRDELTFEIQGTGYQIIRNKAPAKNLSEGEKTAIAFLYFLKSLGDKSFSLSKGIVVIDDPVSSLDSNALFHAFAFMKDRTKDVGQLFIFTHNHSFFRQIKNWFNHLPDQNKKNPDVRPGSFYMLTSSTNGGHRSSISELDSLLHKYESEYHYLFSLVYKAANSEAKTNLQQNYHLPNIARRLLESFLAFRQPSKTGELLQQLELIEFDVAKKTRIIRFLHTYSHAEKISDPEDDSSILIETKQILNNLLELIKKDDERHFDQMKKLVTQ